MYVTQIEVSEFPMASNTLEKRAHVLFQTANCHVQMECAIRDAEDRGNSRLAFIREALRQMRRMPEFRRGREEITFSPELGDPTKLMA